MAKQRGMTLIEMLVALLIFASVMSLSSEAYRYYIVSGQKHNKRFDQALDMLWAQQLLSRQLAGVLLYYAANEEGNRRVLYRGNETELVFVSSNSVRNPGTAALSAFHFQDKRLQYCEQSLESYTAMTVPSTTEEICDSFQIDLLAANTVKFRYFGWPSVLAQLDEQENSPVIANKTPVWLERYYGDETGTVPVVVSLSWSDEMNEQEWWFRLADIDPGRLSYFGSLVNE